MNKKHKKSKQDVSFERLEFPEVSGVDVAFGGYPRDWFYATLALYKSDDDDKWGNMASELFFIGGKVPYNMLLPEDYRKRGTRFLKAIMGSWEPKHEDKVTVCGLILKSICS